MKQFQIMEGARYVLAFCVEYSYSYEQSRSPQTLATLIKAPGNIEVSEVSKPWKGRWRLLMVNETLYDTVLFVVAHAKRRVDERYFTQSVRLGGKSESVIDYELRKQLFFCSFEDCE